MENLVELYQGKEARVSTFVIWAGFGYKEHRTLKRVIEDNRELLEKYGSIEYGSDNNTDKKKAGGQDKSFFLNFEQVLVLSALTKNTPDTKSVKAGIVSKLIDGMSHASLFAIIDLIKNIDVSDLEEDKFVYVAKEENSGRYKIGISKNPEERIKNLNIGNPEKLILVHAYLATEQNNMSENLAHSVFNEHRLMGEWFKENIDLTLLPSYFDSHKEECCDCQCKSCSEFNEVLNAVTDNMTPYEALNAIIEKMGFKYGKAKEYVEILVDLGNIK